MTTRKPSLWRVPAESNESFKVTMLVRRLWQTELLPEAVEILDAYFYFLDYPETNLREEIPPELYEFVAGWAKKYLKSDNPNLVPFILLAENVIGTKTEEVPSILSAELITETKTEEGFWYRSINMFERDERDPLALPRPGSDVGRERYAAALDRHREAGDITINGFRARDHADAWIKVRHKLVKSLAELVRETEARPYTMPDGEDSYSGDYGGRYQRTWKNLKAIDKAIETIS